MQISSDLAGFSMAKADTLRKAMGKKKPEVIAKMREAFVKGAGERRVEPKTAGSIFDLMENFAGYGFNKSHSAAYAMIAYQTAYFKANYPVVLLAALLTSVRGNSDKVSYYIQECRRLNIEILPPDVNESLTNFTVVGDRRIRFGLGAVKNVGEAAVAAIIEARKSGGAFRSLDDFCERVDLRQVNKRVVESLILCGAFVRCRGAVRSWWRCSTSAWRLSRPTAGIRAPRLKARSPCSTSWMSPYQVMSSAPCRMSRNIRPGSC